MRWSAPTGRISETRARIYQSARNALEAGLRKQDIHDPDVIAQQRHRLEAIIHAIETEERATLRARAADRAAARRSGRRQCARAALRAA